MCESLVSFSHSVHFFFSLECSASLVCCIHKFCSKALLHCALRSASRILNYPAKSECLSSLGLNIHRDLIVSTAYTASLALEGGHYVSKSLSEYFEGLFICALFDDVEGAVCNFLSYAL